MGKSYTRIQGVPFPVRDLPTAEKRDSSEDIDQAGGSELETSLPLTATTDKDNLKETETV